VTRIVRDSILDGPGCRYVVFVKGCNLRCHWCHNPETQRVEQEIITYGQFCIRCGRCIEAAPDGVSHDEMPVRIKDTADTRYLPCVEVCPTGALSLVAKPYGTKWLLNDLSKYRTMYTETGGGLTISGGEPLLTKDFSLDFFKQAKELGVHTAIDTSGSFPWTVLEQFLPAVDLWLVDLKHPSDSELKSELVIENLSKLARSNTVIWIRVPIIPRYNDDEQVWKQMADIIASQGKAIARVDLLPYHPYGNARYEALNRPCAMSDTLNLQVDTLEQARATFATILPAERLFLGRTMAQG